MQDLSVLNHNEGNGLPAVHAIVTPADTKYDKRPIATQEFIQEQGKAFYCTRALSTVVQPSSTFDYDWNELFGPYCTY